jgi:excisionase family DNA binding protein
MLSRAVTQVAKPGHWTAAVFHHRDRGSRDRCGATCTFASRAAAIGSLVAEAWRARYLRNRVIRSISNVLLAIMRPMQIDVGRAASILGVSPIQVRRLIAAGELRAERFGRSWQIDLDSVHRYDDLRPAVGRPHGAKRSWDLLAGRRPSSMADARHLAVQARRRAQRRLARVSPGELPHLLSTDQVVASGAVAAAHHGAAVQDRPPHAVYVRQSDLDKVAAAHDLRFEDPEPNVVVRVVPDAVWPFGDSDRYANPVITLIDLIDDRDDRSARETLRAL